MSSYCGGRLLTHPDIARHSITSHARSRNNVLTAPSLLDSLAFFPAF
jgi:hypothetical protein